MTQKEAAIEALDRLADQAVNTAGDDHGRGAAIQDHGLVMRALGAKPVERAAEVAADRWDEGWHAACIALCPYPPDDDRRLWWVVEHIPKDNPYRAALDPDPADRGPESPTGRDGEGS